MKLTDEDLAMLPKPDACIYFAVDLRTQLIKIGCVRGRSPFGNCPATRVRELSRTLRRPMQLIGCLAVPCNRRELDLEKELHERFSKTMVRREWFQLSDDLEGFIRSSTSGHVCVRCAGETVETTKRNRQRAAKFVDRAVRAQPAFRLR